MIRALARWVAAWWAHRRAVMREQRAEPWPVENVGHWQYVTAQLLNDVGWSRQVIIDNGRQRCREFVERELPGGVIHRWTETWHPVVQVDGHMIPVEEGDTADGFELCTVAHVAVPPGEPRA